MLRVEEHLIPRGEQHVLLVGVERRLALILQQRPHLHRHARHHVHCSLAGAGGGRGVGCVGRGEGATRVLTAVGVERRVTWSRWSTESLIANSASGTNSDQSSARSPTKACRTSAMTPLTHSTLLVVLWWCCEPNMAEQRTFG
jgi:hypothetical protein